MTPAPKKWLGQHFLADENILGVIGRLSSPAPEDVVIEIGPGHGVLTAYLAARVAHVHAIELDRALEPALRRRIGSAGNVDVIWGDALRLDLVTLVPPPGKLISNLPYSIATPLVVETLVRVPSLAAWCVMVQREVAERYFAEPGSKAYGAVSVVVQLLARKTGSHPVSRHVFRPPPRVDSALVAFERVPFAGEIGETRRVIDAAFAHRRKTLANSIQLSGLATRETAVSALEAIGRSPSVRAEMLTPHEFVALGRELRKTID